MSEQYLTLSKVSKRLSVPVDPSYLKLLCDQGSIEHFPVNNPGRNGQTYMIPESEIAQIEWLLGNKKEDSKRMLTASETAEILGFTNNYIQMLAREGKLNATKVKVAGKGGEYEYRFNEQDVLDYMEAHEDKPGVVGLSDAAEMTGYSKWNLKVMIKDGKLPCTTVPGKGKLGLEYRIKIEDLNKLETPSKDDSKPLEPAKVVVKKKEEPVVDNDKSKEIQKLRSDMTAMKAEYEKYVAGLKDEIENYKARLAEASKNTFTDDAAYKAAYREGFKDGFDMAKEVR